MVGIKGLAKNNLWFCDSLTLDLLLVSIVQAVKY